MNKKGQEEVIYGILGVLLIFIVIAGYFFISSGNKVSEEFGVSASNNFKIEILNLAREKVVYENQEYILIDLFDKYFENKDAGLKNYLQTKIDKMTSYSQCETIKEHGIAFPVFLNKDEEIDYPYYVIFESKNPERQILFFNKYCNEGGLLE